MFVLKSKYKKLQMDVEDYLNCINKLFLLTEDNKKAELVLKYKGYRGVATFSNGYGMFSGTIEGIPYEGSNLQDLQKNFREIVDKL
jgi:hypothetical protein